MKLLLKTKTMCTKKCHCTVLLTVRKTSPTKCKDPATKTKIFSSPYESFKYLKASDMQGSACDLFCALKLDQYSAFCFERFGCPNVYMLSIRIGKRINKSYSGKSDNYTGSNIDSTDDE